MTNEILRANIIKICKGELNTTEEPIGSNKTKYGLWFGFNGVAWCCIFVCWVFDSAGKRIVVDKNSKGFEHTQKIIDFTDKYNLWTDEPKAGDLVMLEFDGKGYCDHIGIFHSFVTGTRNPNCFEGNTSSGEKGSQNNGDGVYFKPRNEKFVRGYINVDYFLSK